MIPIPVKPKKVTIVEILIELKTNDKGYTIEGNRTNPT